MATRQTPQPVLVRAELTRAQGQSNTNTVEGGWSEKKIRADHPTQAQGFGIGNMLTAGTSDGDDEKDQDRNSGSKTMESTAAEPWTLVTGKKQGRQHKLGEEQEERTSTDRPDYEGPTRDKDNNIKATTPRPTYNQVQLGRRGAEEAKSTAMRPSKKYFSKAAPTGATYAECLGKAQAPLGSTRGARIAARKRDFKRRQHYGPTPAEASGQQLRQKDLKTDGDQRGGGPTLDATKHEGVTGSLIDARCAEDSSSSEESSFSEETTPPTKALAITGMKGGHHHSGTSLSPQ